MNTIAERVTAIISKQFGVEPQAVTPTTRFLEDLGADSFDVVELVIALEDDFGNNIPDSGAQRLAAVQNAIRYLEAASAI